MIKIKGKNKGLTLVEIMVTVTIFLLIFSIIFGLFASALQAQRRSLSAQELLSQTSYVMEYMSRQLRVARSQHSGEWPYEAEVFCVTDAETYQSVNEGHGIRFVNYEFGCIQFEVEGGRLKQTVFVQPPSGMATAYLTSDDLYVEEFNVDLAGERIDDALQPKITLFLKVRSNKKQSDASQPTIEIQNTISQRNLDVPE